MIPEVAVQHAAVEDVELARCIGAGDGRAFELLMRRYNRMLFRLARSILVDETEAEDALQEAYLAAARGSAADIGAVHHEPAHGQRDGVQGRSHAAVADALRGHLQAAALADAAPAPRPLSVDPAGREAQPVRDRS